MEVETPGLVPLRLSLENSKVTMVVHIAVQGNLKQIKSGKNALSVPHSLHMEWRTSAFEVGDTGQQIPK